MKKERIKKLRKEKNISQRKLAKILGLSPSTIAMYETEKRKPDSETLQKIADFFDVSVDYLLGRTDQRQSNNENKKADKIKQALSDDPELIEFWEQLSTREDLKLMFKQTKDLSPESIHRIIEIVKIIEDEERERHGG
ncbi:helix-turn-helix domain-containing protein [Sporohalobacter salinus]|uniref:helix-turn-helix domain-containing protein n=1 Tax=Sporohalobacter salinus TaxID=1494606 RepID=UPI00195F5631|nr:helix-turn-helix transcriptional regulator [Sporohalobacter salinus]MBM7623658.1 transcriptional regulator with XRE-family HTH domain [Sporohalobacter salinus]